jgi:hypothetical protein
MQIGTRVQGDNQLLDQALILWAVLEDPSVAGKSVAGQILLLERLSVNDVESFVEVGSKLVCEGLRDEHAAVESEVSKTSCAVVVLRQGSHDRSSDGCGEVAGKGLARG